MASDGCLIAVLVAAPSTVAIAVVVRPDASLSSAEDRISREVGITAQ